MRAVVFSPDTGFRVTDVETPVAAPDEVVLRVAACGVCGSDRQVASGESAPAGTSFPLVMGHEIAGYIVALGSEVERWSAGDDVVVYPFIECGTCAACIHGQANLCVRQTCIGYARQGGFAEQVAVPAKQLVARPKAVSETSAALLVDAFATPYRAMNDAGVESGQTVLVIGTGGLGLAALRLARAFGVRSVGAVTRRPEGISTATQHGADIAISTDEPERSMARQLRRWAGAGGVDVVIDTIASTGTLALALEVVRPGGTVAVVGMSEDEAMFPVAKTVRRGTRIVASYGSRIEDVRKLMDWAASGRLDPSQLIAGIVPLDQLEKAFSGQRSSGRWVITPNS
ncbi:alcohol dehydrogenase catalytic domain-containing protein [Alicyclobacillus dauci]|uniref:Zinc-binding dehydrogenase n=1 Tax=Alicyclobacillus dauci TaxID=1475485 RepID=A0ABY6Z5S5_9BACL|nr:zinc-binding dehydrogenase [Alicyclobacillus dauci]WAH37863.1 zinc-binding dehydrogenase [Alicyclobacillus dauci]